MQVLASIGQLEFFYDQAPDIMRSCSMAMQLLSVAIGSYLSGAHRRRSCAGLPAHHACMHMALPASTLLTPLQAEGYWPASTGVEVCAHHTHSVQF